MFGRMLMSVAWLGVMTGAGLARAEGQTAPPLAIRAIRMTASQPALVVTIEGTGGLPVPSSGVAHEPPRIFLDFPGVALRATAVTPSSDPRLRRVRAAVHAAKPLVTRVVLDLVALQTYRLEQGPDGVRVIVGEAPGQVSRGIAPVPSLPDPRPSAPASHEPARPPTREPIVTPPATVREASPPMIAPTAAAPIASTPVPGPAIPAPPPPARPPPERPPARSSSPASAPPRGTSPPPNPPQPPVKDVERYKRQISPTLYRLRLQEPLLTSLDSAESQTMDRVQLAVEEFERLRVELGGTKPPDSMRSQHDMLIQSTTLALMATRLRVEAFRTLDPGTLRNAASAAAGATLLLDRVCAELGCPDSGK
jgi:hypothetical protein